jgi:hypothetical protein
MRAFVFTDSALTSRARQFVWLELNVDEERSAAFQEKIGVEALPTYFAVKPDDETVALRGVGAMTVAEIGTFLDDARAALGGVKPSTPRLQAGRLTGGRSSRYSSSSRRRTRTRSAWPSRGRRCLG